MNEVTEHRCGDGFNQHVMIERLDDPPLPGQKPKGNYKYQIHLADRGIWAKFMRIDFQKGPIFEEVNDNIVQRPPNGISNEALLAILLDRFVEFQKGDLACEDNAKAIGHLKKALACCHHRTKDRRTRGVLEKKLP